ncbi:MULTISPECIES: hypothetical protein [unclassified Amycolatopsis]|uniref:hypothetical protein n=1 Tax=unclassified Amycolatopsis TaxID=2618356 RepID=UPI001F2102CB|nr:MULTISPECIES: hypothetical protein [unclassified Amycolatopsis]
MAATYNRGEGRSARPRSRHRFEEEAQRSDGAVEADLSQESLGVLVDWREVGGISFRGVADEDLTITEITRLAPEQTLPVRYRPAVMDHYVALARDADPAHVRQLSDEIATRKRA